MRDSVEEIGQMIRNRRETLQLIQPQLADLAKVSIRTIQLIEAGRANPSLDTLIKVADCLGLDVKLELKRSGKQSVASENR